MHKVLNRSGFTEQQLSVLRTELTRELARVSRSIAEGETSDEQVAIQNALRRIANNEFGTCIACAKSITFGRLTVLPATEYCVDCSR